MVCSELNAKRRRVLARVSVCWDMAATLEDVGREIGLTRERVRQIQVETCAVTAKVTRRRG